MKFSDGFWLNKPGYKVGYATQMYEVMVTKDKKSINVLSTSQFIGNRGQTLGGPVVEVTFTSTMKDTIKVTAEHYKGALNPPPAFELYEDAGFTPEIVETDDAIELISGKTRVRVAKSGGWDIKYFYGDKLLTKESWRTMSYIEEEAWLTNNRKMGKAGSNFWAEDESGQNSYMRAMLNISVGESIYGFGEKFSTFVKNGQSVEVWNNDGGTCSEQTYKSIPFFTSTRGYGVFVNHPEKVMFEVASETVSKTSIAVQGQRLEYFIIGGEKIANVIETYTDLTGKPALVPAYTFGLWLTTSFTTNYDEETCNSFIDEMERRDIPLEVFHYDCFWMREFRWCDFTWDDRMFPEPAAMLKRLKAKGLKVCVWINPYVGQRSSLFAEGVENGYFIKNKDGSVFQCDMWQPGLAIVDFTNPAACKWYADKLKVLCEMGVDAFKTDFGERIPTNVTYFDGSCPFKMHNYYSFIYNKVVFDVLKDFYGENNACLFARSSTVGGQQFPVHWGGDCFSNYESMWETIRGGLSLCMSGFGYFSHDISGFEATGSPDLYKRWSAFGLLSTHSRLHGNSSYRVPWNFDEESCDVVRHFVKLKGKLMPYLYAQAVKTSKTGIPMMRAMVMEYADDPATHNLDRQYFLGDNLLIAPVFDESGIAQFYLPAGRWTDIQTNEVLEGGKWIERKFDYMSMPMYAKPNSIIAYGDFKRSFDYNYADGAKFVVYSLADGASAESEIYDRDGKFVLKIIATRSGDTITVKSEGGGKFTVESAENLKVITE